MTDKEIIEIDGINVLECEHYQYKSLKDCEMRYPESGDCEIGLLNYLFNGNLDIEKYCKDNPNCYFKQLARKTQKYNELLEQHKELDDRANRLIEEKYNLSRECEQIKEKYEALKLENQEGYEIVAELKHECEELLKENQQLRNSLSDSLMFKFTGQENETNRYRKALDDIQKIALRYVEAQGRYDILDIINKAKGEIMEIT